MSSLGQPSGIAPQSLWGLGLFFFLASLFLYTRHADFPSYYHADEPSKVDQLIHQYRNFKHPPLMLNVAEAFSALLGTPRDAESLVHLGRFLSALYAAGTIALLAVLAAYLRNGITGALAGFLCLLSPPFYEAAHYFKEDTLFLFLGTLTVTLAVFHRFRIQSTDRTEGEILCWASVFGICSGLLACSRYFTLLLLPFVFFGLNFHRRPRTALFFLAGLLLTVAAIHLPSLRWLPFFLQELPLETHYMVKGHYDVGLPAPHGEYFRYWRNSETNPAIWFFLTVFFLSLVRKPKSGPWTACALLLLYWLVLSCLPKYSERYLLPVLLGTLFFAAWGAGDLAQFLSAILPRWKTSARGAAWILAFVSLGAFSISGFLRMEKAFREDSRSELAAWIRQNLPPGSHIAQDDLVRMEALAGNGYPCLSAEFAPDLGTVEELRAQGIRYVAITRRTHFPYTEPGLLADAASDAQFVRRHEFYLRLLQKGKILWQAPDQNPKILHPGITLIDIEKIPPN